MNERSRRPLIPVPITKWHFDGLLISEIARWNLKDRQSPGLCLPNNYSSYSAFICLKGSLCCQSKDKMAIPSLHWIGFLKSLRTILQFQNRRRCLSWWKYTKESPKMGHCSVQWAGWAADVYHNDLTNHTVTSSFTLIFYYMFIFIIPKV